LGPNAPPADQVQPVVDDAAVPLAQLLQPHNDLINNQTNPPVSVEQINVPNNANPSLPMFNISSAMTLTPIGAVADLFPSRICV
jgi:hypothetical protein